jgi:hypothetical protein
MIGKQVGNSLLPGQHVYGDLVYAKSQKGNEYWKLKSAKIPEGVQRPADSPIQATAQQATGQQPVNMSAQMPDWFQPWANTIKETHKMVKDLHGGEETPPPVAEEPAAEPEKPTIMNGEPLPAEEVEEIEGMFAPEVDA